MDIEKVVRRMHAGLAIPVAGRVYAVNESEMGVAVQMLGAHGSIGRFVEDAPDQACKLPLGLFNPYDKHKLTFDGG